MAIVAIPPFYWPMKASGTGSTVGVMDAAGEKQGWVFPAPKSGDIDRVCIAASVVTTATDTDVRLETVDPATGLPTGTLRGTNTNVTLAAGSFVVNTVIEVTLTAPATVTKNDLIALVLVPTGTPSISLRKAVLTDACESQMPSNVQDVGAGWTKLPIAGYACIAIRYSDGSYPYMPAVALTPSTVAPLSFSSSSNPDERGNRFRLTAPMRVSGMWAMSSSAVGDFDFVLYDDSSNVLASVAYDGSADSASVGDYRWSFFASAVTLAANTWYRMVIKPTTTTTTSASRLDPGLQARIEQTIGTQDFYLTTRVDAGAWTDTVTEWQIMGLIIDGIDAGGGGGGAVPGSVFSQGVQRL